LFHDTDCGDGGNDESRRGTLQLARSCSTNGGIEHDESERESVEGGESAEDTDHADEDNNDDCRRFNGTDIYVLEPVGGEYKKSIVCEVV